LYGIEKVVIGSALTGTAVTWLVDQTANGGMSTFQETLSVAATSDTIRVAPGTYIGSAAEFATLVAAAPAITIVLDAGFNATVTDSISVTAVNALAAITPGIVTATLATGNLESFSTLAETGNAYTITVNDAAEAPLAATALSTLGGKTTSVVTVSNAVGISGTADEVTAALVTAETLVVAATAKVTVTDAIGVAAVNDIAAKTSGVVTATLTTGNLASFSDLAETGNAYTIAVNDAADALLVATALSTLGGKTTAVVTVSNAAVISGTTAEVTAALVTAATLVVAASAKITVSDPISVAAVNVLAGLTSGVVTSTVVETDVTTLLTLSDSQVNAYTITVVEAATATATDLLAIDAKTSVTVNALGVATITGTLAEALAATANQANLDTAANVAITLAAGTASLTDLLSLDGRTSGLINATAITGFTGTAAEFDTFLAAVSSGQVSTATNYSATVTDPSVAQLTAVDSANGSGSLNYTTVLDTAAVLVNNAGGYITGSANAIVTNTVNISQLATIDSYNLVGGVSVASSGKISDTFTNLLNDRLTNGGDGTYVIDGPNVEVAVSASGVSVANAQVLAGVTGISVASSATISITGAASEILGGIAQINAGFEQSKVLFTIAGSVSNTDLQALVDLGAVTNNVSTAAANFPENYTIAAATWAAQRGFSSQMTVFGPLDLDQDPATLQAIDVTTLNATLLGTYTYEGLLKSILTAGWTNVTYAGGDAAETLNLTGFANAARSLSINSGAGNDNVTGTTSADLILGGEGNDTISGGPGNDTISGGAGDDRLTGGSGADVLSGGDGADTFVFASGDSGIISSTVFDTISDYTAGGGGDRLDLVGAPPTVRANASDINVSGATADLDTITGNVASGIISLSGDGASNVNTLDEWISVARTIVTVSGQVAAFEYGSDTYVNQENGSGDLLIKLENRTGLTSVGTSAGDNNSIWVS
jgi:hypothetical protein